MSATVLRDRVRDALQQQIDAHAGYLVDRHTDSLEQIRINQGKVTAFRESLEILNKNYRDLY